MQRTFEIEKKNIRWNKKEQFVFSLFSFFECIWCNECGNWIHDLISTTRWCWCLPLDFRSTCLCICLCQSNIYDFSSIFVCWVSNDHSPNKKEYILSRRKFIFRISRANFLLFWYSKPFQEIFSWICYIYTNTKTAKLYRIAIFEI